jgi:hypothetical protein
MEKMSYGELDSTPMAGSFPLIPESELCISYKRKILKILTSHLCCEKVGNLSVVV